LRGIQRRSLCSLKHASAASQNKFSRTVRRDLWADYLLEKNPAAGTKIRVDVEGKELKILD
jgi:hypothetical protein